MSDHIHVRGEGGGIFRMLLPLPRHMQKKMDAGQITRVNPDGTPYEEPKQSARGRKKQTAAPADPGPETPADTGSTDDGPVRDS